MAANDSATDDLLLLSQNEAVKRHLDSINLRSGRRMLWFFVATAFLYVVAFFSGGRPVSATLALVNLLAVSALLRSFSRDFVASRVRQILMSVLLFELTFLLVVHGPRDEGFRIWAYLLPLALLFLRFQTSEYLLVQVTFFVVTVFGSFVASVFSGDEASLATALQDTGFVGYGVDHALILLIASRLTRRERRRYLGFWTVEVERNRERLRMKQELEHAREIQLSMLPRTSPETGWLDIASLSLPATEVGGDYYDYFPVDDHRLVIVIGDVAGHGVASGIVLSGVRSGLNLLEEEVASPAAVMEKLNRMVCRTTPRRMIVALMVAVFDRSSRTVTVAAAGHPPLLLRRREDGEVAEITGGSLPLGAREDTSFDEAVVSLEHGDALLMFTDGLAETLDGRGEPYGYDRVASRFAHVAEEPSARHVRDGLLRDLWAFKGTTEQIDDVTMVVVRVNQ